MPSSPHPVRCLAARLLNTAALLAALATPCLTWAASVEEIWKLLDAGSAREAYQMATETLPEGSPDRDLVLGLAALEAGNNEEAVTRLKRHLEAFPAHRQNPRAHLELGRAYFRLGQLASARAEFEAVLADEPPEMVARNIRQALAAIDQERDALLPRFGGFVELGLGYDSNINSGVSDPDVNLPIYGEIRLGEAAVEQDAAIATAAAGVEVNKAIRRDLGLFAAARMDARLHNNHSALDQFSTSLSGGVARALGKDTLRGSLSWNAMRLDWDVYRDTVSGTLEWNRTLGERSGVGTYAQIGRISYEGGNRARDADTYALGAAYSRSFEAEMKPLMRLSASYSLEDNRRGFKSLGRETPSFRASLDLRPSEPWTVSGALSWQGAHYRAPGDANTRRRDDYWAVSLAAHHQIDKRWSASAETEYSRNTSNLELYEYNRTTVMFKVRRDFR